MNIILRCNVDDYSNPDGFIKVSIKSATFSLQTSNSTTRSSSSSFLGSSFNSVLASSCLVKNPTHVFLGSVCSTTIVQAKGRLSLSIFISLSRLRSSPGSRNFKQPCKVNRQTKIEIYYKLGKGAQIFNCSNNYFMYTLFK